MAFLFERLSVTGRLQYISHQAEARDFEGDQIAVIHLLNVPDGQDVDAQLGFITSQLPTFVAGFGGTYDDGSQWMITFERGPAHGGTRQSDIRKMRRHLARVIELDQAIEVVQELVLTRQQLRTLYPRSPNHGLSRRARAEGALVMVDPDNVGVTDLLRGIAVEACGLSLADLCRAYPTGCAFPMQDHTCTGNVYNDVFQAWNERRIAPGGEEDPWEEVSDAEGFDEPVHEPEPPRAASKPRGPQPPASELRPQYEAQIGHALSDDEIDFIWHTGMW